MRTTEEVLNHHMQAFGEGLESILSDYDEKSCVISGKDSFHGMAEIRAFFTAFVTGLPAGFMEAFEITSTVIDKEVAYITWEAKPFVPFGTDTFIVRNGKFLYQTIGALMV